MFIQSNIEAMQSYLSLSRTDAAFNKSLAKVSSGMRLPKPQYGGGQFAVANDMEALYQEYTVGAANVQDAQGLLEVAQTTMLEVNDLVLQMNELAHRAATDTVNDDQRAQMDTEFRQLRTDMADLLDDVRFNDLSLHTNQSAHEFSIVFGENSRITVSTYVMTQSALGLSNVTHLSGGVQITSGGGNVSFVTIRTANWASNAMSAMDTVVNNMSELLAQVGAQIQEVEGKVNILNEQAVQQKALESRINELDFAKEMKNFTSLQVVLQGSNAMVAQANMKAQMVLQLFGG